MSKKPTLKERIGAYLQSFIPTRLLPLFNKRYQLAYVANTLTVDDLHDILREAEVGNTQRLFALYRDVLLGDSHIQAEFFKRKLAVIGDVLSIQPKDKTNPEDVAASKFLADADLEDMEDWMAALSHLMDSTLWPVSVVEKVFKPKKGGGFELARLVPVEAHLFDFRDGTLQIKDVDPISGNMLSTVHRPTPDRYIVHRGHLLTTADNWGGPMRSILFWWLLGTMDRDWWARFLDRFGSPFLVGKYTQSDDSSRSVLEHAFAAAVKIGGLVVSKETQVEIVQAAAQSTGEAFEKFLTIAQREKSKLILGQTLSAEAHSTGLGSGVANAQDGVRQDIRQFDAKKLGNTLRTQLVKQLLFINNIPGSAPKLIWGSQSTDEIKGTGAFLKDVYGAGIELADDGIQTLSEQCGYPLRRSSTPPSGAGASPLGLTALSADLPILKKGELAGDEIARATSAELSQAFSGSLAPIRLLIAHSTSAAELEAQIKAFYADWSPEKTAAVTERALVAFAANGAAGVK